MHCNLITTENALADENIGFAEAYNNFLKADTVKSIVRDFNIICRSNSSNSQRLIYKSIQASSNYWKAEKLWAVFNKRLEHPIFNNQTHTKDLHVLIIGCGPVGLRMSIECAFLGVKCTIIEKRNT